MPTTTRPSLVARASALAGRLLGAALEDRKQVLALEQAGGRDATGVGVRGGGGVVFVAPALRRRRRRTNVIRGFAHGGLLVAVFVFAHVRAAPVEAVADARGAFGERRGFHELLLPFAELRHFRGGFRGPPQVLDSVLVEVPRPGVPQLLAEQVRLVQQ